MRKFFSLFLFFIVILHFFSGKLNEKIVPFFDVISIFFAFAFCSLICCFVYVLVFHCFFFIFCFCFFYIFSFALFSVLFCSFLLFLFLLLILLLFFLAGVSENIN